MNSIKKVFINRPNRGGENISHNMKTSEALSNLEVDTIKIRFLHLASDMVGKVKSRSMMAKVNRERSKVKSGALWQYEDKVLWQILETSRKNYLELIKLNHPDMKGGSLKKAAALTVSWKLVKKMFFKRNYELQ